MTKLQGVCYQAQPQKYEPKRNGRQLQKYLQSSFIVTKTEADPEIRDYAAMDNDIVDGLYNKIFLLEQVLMMRIFTGRSELTKVSRPTSPTVNY